MSKKFGQRELKNRDLIAKAQKGDENARDEVVRLNMKLVQKIAGRYINKTDEYEDILQIGYMALIKAVDRFDLSKGTHFSTFAYRTVSGEILNYFRDFAFLIKKKKTSNFMYKKIQDFQFHYFELNGEYPTTKQIAEHIGTTVEEVEFTINENQPLCYLSDTRNNDFSDDKAMTIEESLELKSIGYDDFNEVILKETIKTILTEEEIILFNYNLNDLDKKTISKLLGKPEYKVRKEIRNIKNKLQRYFLNYGF